MIPFKSEKNMRHCFPLFTVCVLATLSVQGGALITSAPAGSTTTVFGTGPTCATGVDAGFAVTGQACANYSRFFGFGENGFWNDPPSGFGLVGGSNPSGSFTINLGGLYSSVGGFMNYAVEPGSSGSDSIPAGDPTLIALAANGTTVLDTFDLVTSDPINTPAGTNAGAFVGIQDSTNDIAYLEFSNDDIAIHSITLGTTSSSSAPEPSAFLLLGSGLALLAAGRRAITFSRRN
jgi:hypothetical protein